MKEGNADAAKGAKPRTSPKAVSIELLKREIEELKRSEECLARANCVLEESIRERTSELVSANEKLKREVRERKDAELNLRKYHRKLQSLASELSLAEERQRRIVANELHERLGQVLAICKMKAADAMDRANSAELRQHLEEILSLIGNVIQDTRHLTKELTPPVLYEFGVLSAIEWLAERFQERYGIRIELDITGNIAEDHNLQILLYQSIRELLMNCVKHARAEHVTVSVRDEGFRTRIEVRDDGRGFDTMFIEWSDGFGLFSIRERLRYIGGELVIESEPGAGTRITILAPVRGMPFKKQQSGSC